MGFETSDDAAVYRVAPGLAVISTADFITPPVDDPAWFGRIAAANALSDVYAMGGRPLIALNLVMFPSKKLPAGVLRDMLAGGFEKVREAGAVLAGGHSVDDLEPKYGMAVTGVVSPEKVLTNAGARPGDALVLTKPLGTGVLFNACRSKKLPYRDLEVLLPGIAALNRAAAEAAQGFEIHACTDITGFGVIGHALEVARSSSVRIGLDYGRLPLLPHARAMYRKGETTGSNRPNRRMAEGAWHAERTLDRSEEELLFDPQTSGGLLFALPSPQADGFAARLKQSGVADAAVVGEVQAGPPSVVIR